MTTQTLFVSQSVSLLADMLFAQPTAAAAPPVRLPALLTFICPPPRLMQVVWLILRQGAPRTSTIKPSSQNLSSSLLLTPDHQQQQWDAAQHFSSSPAANQQTVPMECTTGCTGCSWSKLPSANTHTAATAVHAAPTFAAVAAGPQHVCGS